MSARGHFYLAQLIDRVRADARRRGYPPPERICLDADWFRRRRAREPASTDYRAGVIYLNPAHSCFRTRKHMRRSAWRAFRAGHASSGDPGHILRHELGHLLHAARAGADWMDLHKLRPVDARRAVFIREQVSRRAAVSPTEFVAEVFAGLWAGQEYDAIILEWYQEWNGPAEGMEGWKGGGMEVGKPVPPPFHPSIPPPRPREESTCGEFSW